MQEQQIEMLTIPVPANALKTAGAVLKSMGIYWDLALVERLPGAVEVSEHSVDWFGHRSLGCG
jgi:hypothetical protein